MAEEFAIFRLPGGKEIQGFFGGFNVWSGSISERDGFVIQSFNARESPWILLGEAVTGINEIEQKLKTLPLLSTTNEKESDAVSWHNYIEDIKYNIQQGEIRKCVAARIRILDFSPANMLSSFKKACKLYPDAFVYMLFHKQSGLWMGATPEKLIFAEGDSMSTIALAGTIFNNTEHWTEKEREENQATADYIESTLVKAGAQHVQKSEITELKSGNLRHLALNFSFRLNQSKLTGLLQTFHPTPAVAGLPKEKALGIIDKNENFERGLYSGWLGVFQHTSFKSWVNLRCARIYDSKAVLFAGAGVNSGSLAQREWDETGLKMQIIGSCLTEPQ